MSSSVWANEKSSNSKRHSLARRLVRGPVLIIALGVGSSGVLIAALVLASIFEF